MEINTYNTRRAIISFWKIFEDFTSKYFTILLLFVSLNLSCLHRTHCAIYESARYIFQHYYGRNIRNITIDNFNLYSIFFLSAIHWYVLIEMNCFTFYLNQMYCYRLVFVVVVDVMMTLLLFDYEIDHWSYYCIVEWFPLMLLSIRIEIASTTKNAITKRVV